MSKNFLVYSPFTVLVAHAGRTAFRQQRIADETTNGFKGLLTGTESASTATIVVADNDFTDAAILYLGDYILESDVHWVPGASTDLSATALAAAIDNLPGFTAVAVGSTISVTGPSGPGGGYCVFKVVYKAAIVNYTLSPDDGTLAVGGQTISNVQVI